VCSCGCGKPPGPGRHRWHSQACVDAWLVLNSPQHVRKLVMERDNGVCSMCGTDTLAMRSRFREAYHEISRYVGWWARTLQSEVIKTMPPDNRSWHGAYMEARRRCGADAWQEELLAPYASRDWQADHILPVCMGGGQCGLEGYRTLCTPCHKQVTRKLAADRAKARRSAHQHPELAL
jgi:5-methylcytosine-specific restriction protein A